MRDQLKELYGPLFLLSGAADKAWTEFRKQFRPGRSMSDKNDPLSQDEKSEYIRWLDVVFVPSNNKMRSIVESNAHLFVEGRAPHVVLELLAHFDSLNVVLSKLRAGVDGNVFPAIGYPKGFSGYIRKDYLEIVERHTQLTAGKVSMPIPIGNRDVATEPRVSAGSQALL